MNLKIENQAKEEQKPTWGERFDLIKDYFVNSDEKLMAWLLLVGILFCVVSFVALNALLSWLFTSIWGALVTTAITPFLIALAEFTATLIGMTTLYTLQNYLIGKLIINWRNWLSHKIKMQLFENKEFINLKRTSDISDISQRIQEDIREFVELSISLGAKFLNAALTFGVFIGSLWVLSGALDFVVLGVNIVIPGYLVWASIFIAIAASHITYYLGRSLPALNQKAEQAEASFRQHLETINTEAENIALEQTDPYHCQIIEKDMENIQKTADEKLGTQTLVVAFQDFYSNFTVIVPILLTAPLYFAGLIGIAQIEQVGMSFSQVSIALNWFAHSYEKIANYQTKMDRIIGIYHAIADGMLKANPMNIKLKVKESTSIIIKNLSIQKPLLSNANYIMRNVNVELKQNEHTLIIGKSGLGKSTFFKVIRGIWGYGVGKIKLPKDKTLFFLSQKPTVVNDTLMAMLASPKPSSAYTKEQYLEAMGLVKYMDKLIPDLEKQRDWSSLSGGEKQMVAFARALLQKPDWLFLDEISSSLDEEAEYYLYDLLKTQLPETTIVSIAHRSTVKVHHDRVIKFGCPNEKNVMEVVSDERKMM